jgi:spermidine synthase
MSAFSTAKTIHYQETPFQAVRIVDDPTFGVSLIVDGDLNSTAQDEKVYHEALVHPALIASGKPSRVLIGGGGEGATLREVLRHVNVQECVMVDIDEIAVNMYKQYLPTWSDGAFNSPRLRLLHDDVANFLRESSDASFDVIIFDLSDPLEEGCDVSFLYTKECYELIASKLAPDGIFVTQSCAVYDEPNTFSAIHNTLKLSFKHVELYSTFVPSFESEWAFNIAHNRPDLQVSKLPIDSYLDDANMSQNLTFYDGETHSRMFLLNKIHRKILSSETHVHENGKVLPYLEPSIEMTAQNTKAWSLDDKGGFLVEHELRASHGIGVFATEFVPKGTHVYDCSIRSPLSLTFSRDDLGLICERERDFILEYSNYYEKYGWILRADNSRFVNHSFSPNIREEAIEGGPMGTRGVLIAVRDIEIGDEILIDYTDACDFCKMFSAGKDIKHLLPPQTTDEDIADMKDELHYILDKS